MKFSLIGSISLVCTCAASGVVLLQDDFNDDSIDSAKWNVVIPNGASVGTPTVTETSGRIELEERGHLNSAFAIDPDAYVGGIQITGTWIFTSADDFFQILTRSDGAPAGQYGETANGVEFYITLTDSVQIRTRNNANISVTSDTTDSLTRVLDTPYDFSITDGEGSLSFTITERGNSANTATATATLNSVNASYTDNLVSFHNREGGSRTAYLDDVTISSIPEPTSSALMLLSLGALAFRRR